jgi:hypothetical protein
MSPSIDRAAVTSVRPDHGAFSVHWHGKRAKIADESA